ncbi:MAG: Carboxymethylenebutenolidase [Candidatus Eremiobacteraeota bacterium]|jgi:carboxymethylenebutenolidase|nr:Carboxymethylenebutenolidase [Candidatus Eremiobacteraeota bacterium]
MQQQRYESGQAGFVETGGGKRAYYARPAGDGPFPGVLVFQEAFGVNDYIQSETRRLAEHGYAAIAPDIFDGATYSYDDRDSVFPRLQSLTDEAMMERVSPAVAYLDAQPQVKKRAYGAVGFCMGGRLAVLAAIELGERIAAAAAFYGGGIAPEVQRAFSPLLERLAQVKGELLLLYGADDASIEPREHGRIAETLSAHKKAYALVVYPGAQHAFASHARPSMYNADAARMAWNRTFELLDRRLR